MEVSPDERSSIQGSVNGSHTHVFKVVLLSLLFLRCHFDAASFCRRCFCCFCREISNCKKRHEATIVDDGLKKEPQKRNLNFFTSSSIHPFMNSQF